MHRVFLALCGFSGVVAVGAGAFGAHALRSTRSPELLAAFQTGVLYHLVHTLALAGIAFATAQGMGRYFTIAGWLFVAGIALFSGSLYSLAITGIRGFGAITPVGGLCLLAGWLTWAIAALQKR